MKRKIYNVNVRKKQSKTYPTFVDPDEQMYEVDQLNRNVIMDEAERIEYGSHRARSVKQRIAYEGDRHVGRKSNQTNQLVDNDLMDVSYVTGMNVNKPANLTRKSKNYPSYIDNYYNKLVSTTYAMDLNSTRTRCGNGNSIKLDTYQKFVSSYIHKFDVGGILLWHNTGAGKTCTSVEIISKYFKQFPSKDVCFVLLPTKKDVEMYFKQFMEACPSITRDYEIRQSRPPKDIGTERYKMVELVDIHNKYRRNHYQNDGSKTTLYSSENIRRHRVVIIDFKSVTLAMVRGTLVIPGVQLYNTNIFEDNLVIVDEADVLLQSVTAKYPDKIPDYAKINRTGHGHEAIIATDFLLQQGMKIPPKARNNGQLINYKNNRESLPPTRKIVLMTATPYIEKPEDITYLLKILNPFNTSNMSLEEMSNGLISYIDNTKDLTLYPKMFTMSNDGYVTHVSDKFAKDVTDYFKAHKYNNNTNLYKKINVMCSGPKCRTTLPRTVDLMTYEDAPKIERLLHNIINSDTTHKHLVYVNNKQAGSRIIQHYIQKYAGMKLYDEHAKTRHKLPGNSSSFAILNTSGNQTKETQNKLLEIYNSNSNKNGDVIKLLIIQGKSFLRASTFKAVRYLHIMTPLIDTNEYQQLIGRVRRRCSHNQLSKSQWTVAVIPYIIANSPDTKALEKRAGKLSVLTDMISICKRNAIDRRVYNKHKMHVNITSTSLLNL